MLDVEQESAAGSERPPDIPEHLPQVLNVVQCQIGNHDVPGTFRVLIGFDPAMSVPDLLIPVSPLRLRQHLLA